MLGKVIVIHTHWVAVKDLHISYYIRETLVCTMYTQDGNLISVPKLQPITALAESLWILAYIAWTCRRKSIHEP